MLPLTFITYLKFANKAFFWENMPIFSKKKLAVFFLLFKNSYTIGGTKEMKNIKIAN